MPVRLLRDWTDSERVAMLSHGAERFFTRLIMKVDDYGLFASNTSLLKANLFPLALTATKDSDIEKWLKECLGANLIQLYQAEGKKCLQILNFKQRMDRAKSKYPLPPVTISGKEKTNLNDSERSLTNNNDCLLETDTETYADIEAETDKGRRRFAPPSVEEVVLYFTEKGYSETAARKAFEYYTTGNWHDSNGNKIRNWKMKMLSVWFKPENLAGTSIIPSKTMVF